MSAPWPRFRIKAGETIMGFVTSNAAVSVQGRFRVEYDDGDSTLFGIDAFTTGAGSAREVIGIHNTVPKDGVVVGGILTASGTKGNTYAVLFTAMADTSASARQELARGYVYDSLPLSVGIFVDPALQGTVGTDTMVQPA